MLPTNQLPNRNPYRIGLIVAAFFSITVVSALTDEVRPVFAQSAGPSWRFTGILNQPRSFASATTLQDGRVLIAGGNGAIDDYVPLNSAELYDPVTGAWTMTGPLVSASGFVNLTLLA